MTGPAASPRLRFRQCPAVRITQRGRGVGRGRAGMLRESHSSKEDPMSELNWTPAEVAEFYDGSSPMANNYFFGYQHLGYWYDENDDTPLEEAEKRLTRKIVDTLGLPAGGTLLDAGCGTGVPAIHIAGEYGAQITAITISPVEAETARVRAGESDVS